MMPSETELRQLLPWYVNGTLDGTLMLELHALVEESPLVGAEVAWLRQLRQQIQKSQSRIDQRPADAGLETLMSLVHGEQAGKISPFRLRLKSWATAPRRIVIPLGLAAAVVLAQAVIIGALLEQGPADRLEALSGQPTVSGPVIQIVFKPSATEIEIRTVLAAVHGDIVSGPGALGLYTIRVPPDSAALSLGELRRASSVVESAALLQSR